MSTVTDLLVKSPILHLGGKEWPVLITHEVILRFEKEAGVSTLAETPVLEKAPPGKKVKPPFSPSRLSAAQTRALSWSAIHRISPSTTLKTVGGWIDHRSLGPTRDTLLEAWRESMPEPETDRQAHAAARRRQVAIERKSQSAQEAKYAQLLCNGVDPKVVEGIREYDKRQGYHRTSSPERRIRQKAKSWLELWAEARGNLRLTDAEWLSYTPRQVQYLDRCRLESLQHMEMIGSIVASTVANYSTRKLDNPIPPDRYMIHPLSEQDVEEDEVDDTYNGGVGIGDLIMATVSQYTRAPGVAPPEAPTN